MTRKQIVAWLSVAFFLPLAAFAQSWSNSTGWSTTIAFSTITGTASPTQGGTGLTSYTTGDVVYASATNVLSKLGIGSSGNILTVSGGVPAWAPPAATGATSVGLSLPAFFTISNSPVTTTGTLTAVLASQSAHTFLGTAGAGVPTFIQPAFTDISGTIASAQLASSLAIPGNPTTTTQSQNDNSTKLATTAYADTAVSNAIAAVNPAIAVTAATTGALPNSPTYNNGVAGVGATLTAGSNTTLTTDSVTFNALTQSALVKNQASAFQNGIYNVTQVGSGILPWILTRRLDYDQSSDINNTGAIPVISGTVNGSTSWVETAQVTTVGTDALTFAQFSINPTTVVNSTASPASGDIATFTGSGVTVSNSIVPFGTNAKSTLTYPSLRNLGWWYISGTGAFTGYIGNGTRSPTQTGTQTPATDSTGAGCLMTSNATTNATAICINNTYDTCQFQTQPVLMMKIKTGPNASDLTVQRTWVGLTSAAITATGTPTTQHVAAFRYATDVDGTAFWRTVTCDGASSVTTTTTTVAVTNATQYLMTIDMTVAGTVTFLINGVVVATHTTNLPATSTSMGAGITITTLENVAKSFVIQKMEVRFN